MGVKIFDVLPSHPVEFEALKNKVVVIDGNLVLYQFLSSIRQPDGTPLTDSHSQVTSHLQGLFSRSVNLMQKGIQLVFVFDGKAPALKLKEQMRRRNLKEAAKIELKSATETQDVALMKKYASRTSSLTRDMVSEAKELLDALGVPVVQAPSEGEAQAAKIVLDGRAYAVGTQDADAFLFRAPRVIKNLTVSEKRKAPGKLTYALVVPERFELSEILSSLNVTQEQLIALSMLVGTDYNRGGVPGIGPKKALKIVKENSAIPRIFEAVKWSDHFDIPWKEVFDTIDKIPVEANYDIKWNPVNINKVQNILCERHDFSSERILASIDKLKDVKTPQKGLGQWF